MTSAAASVPDPGPAVPALALRKVDRSFGPIQILHGITLELYPGEVHALIGENGAGKSTAMKIMSGYLAPTGGGVEIGGRPVSFALSREAEAQGVTLIHQEFNLAQLLSVQQNIFLGHELKRGFLLDHKAMRAQTQALLDRLETRLDPNDQVAGISVPEKQMVEIAKALSREARVRRSNMVGTTMFASWRPVELLNSSRVRMSRSSERRASSSVCIGTINSSAAASALMTSMPSVGGQSIRQWS